MKKRNNKVDITQTGIFSYLERISRSHPYIYFFARNLAFYLNIFEKEFDGIRNINFKKEKINLIDVGASDGIAIKYINKIKPLKHIYAFEPNQVYYERLIKFKSNFKNLSVFNFGLSNKKQKHTVFIPYIRLLGKMYHMITYTFYNLDELKHNLKINYIFKKQIKIDKVKINLSTYDNFKHNIDLVKIDVNGHELNVVKGILRLIKKDKPAIILEELDNITKIAELLSKYDYKCYNYSLKSKILKKINRKRPENLNYYFLQKKHFS